MTIIQWGISIVVIGFFYERIKRTKKKSKTDINLLN
jgi:hypothetical protein